MSYRIIFFILLFCTTSLVIYSRPIPQPHNPRMITSINIIDRNGMSETISSKERLAQFNKIDFSAPQPYQKVLRIYQKDKRGNRASAITSYHPNGQLKQSLEAMNYRAYGPYLEFYANGQKKIESQVIGGIADINAQAEQTWLFDGISKAWDEEGALLAEVLYNKGVLEGTTVHYHPNGTIWKKIPYKNNLLEGDLVMYLSDGTLLQKTSYKAGIAEGKAVRFWNNQSIAYEENYCEGKLLEADYFSQNGSLISQIRAGSGMRTLFGKEGVEEFQEFRNGRQEGLIQIFDENGLLARSYYLHENEKEGEEYDYFPSTKESLPKLMITWKEGVMQGPVQSWYPSGQIESRKEMSQNRKNGFATSWYHNGSIMYVEEYDNDVLIKGEYYRINEKEPASLVKKGQGIALLFDAEGALVQKITYHDGKPTL